MATATRSRARKVPAPAASGENGDPEETVPLRMVNGLAVVKDEGMPSSLPTPPGHTQPTYKTFRLLTLADGSQVTGCGECNDFAGTRGQVQKHRYDVHNAPKPGRKSSGESPISAEIASMTVADLVELAANAAGWGARFEELEDKVEEWKVRALKAEAWQRRTILKFNQMGFTLKAGDED